MWIFNETETVNGIFYLVINNKSHCQFKDYKQLRFLFKLLQIYFNVLHDELKEFFSGFYLFLNENVHVYLQELYYLYLFTLNGF